MTTSPEGIALIFSLKLDQHQLPYWSGMVMANNTCLMEVVSVTFNPRNKKEFRDLFENCACRLIKVLQGAPDQDDIVRHLIQSSVVTDNPGGGLLIGTHNLKPKGLKKLIT
jgi:hypothetical protein